MVLVGREASNPSEADRLSRSRFFDRMADLLVNDDTKTATGWVVGLTGPWGSGKTKALYAIRERVESKIATADNPILILDFNPWLHSGRDELIQSLFDLLRTKAEESKGRYPELKHVTSVLHKHRKNIGRAGALMNILFKGSGGLVQTLTEHSLEEQRAEILNGLKQAKASAIVLVDEIDRLSDEEIRGIAQMVKSVADFSMFSYLLAYDPVRVATALGGADNVKLGHAYLEKIVQVQMRLPRADPHDLIKMALDDIMKALQFYGRDRPSQTGEPLPDREELLEVLRFLVPNILSTPRDIRRLAAAFEARLPVSGVEVGVFDLLRYCALESRVPILSDRLQSRTKRVSVDGSRELMRLPPDVEEAEACIRWVLGEFHDEPLLRDLLLYLFPALREGGAEAITRDDRRLCYETPLLVLLNCGPLPGMLTAEQVEQVLTDPARNMAPVLDDAAANGRLRHAVLRLRTRLARRALTKVQMESVWTAVAHYFDRPFDPSDSPNWNVWPELTHVLVRGAMRRFLAKDRHPISAEFTAALIDQGFVHLPAAILYYHAQAHELRVQKDASLIPTLMDEQSTRDLIDIAGASFRARITGSRDWFLRSAHPLWITHMQDPQADAPWQQLSNPTTASQLYGIILLLMRTREDYLPFRPSAPGSAVNLRLTELVRMDALVDHWRRLRLDDPDLSSPITEANAFMVRQGRGSKAGAGAD